MVPRDPVHDLPAIHALHLAELVASRGVTAERLLAGVVGDRAELSDPDARISLEVVQTLVERARALTGEPALGVLLGLEMRVAAHGYLGFAAMTARSLGAAIDLAVRFAPTRTEAIALRLETAGAAASLVIDERAEFGTARDVVVLAIAVGLWQIGSALTGRQLEGSLELAFERPDYADRFETLIGRVRFGRPENRFLFSTELLDLPLAMADPAATRLAQEQCERTLAQRAPARLATRVRELLGASQRPAVEPLEKVAATFHVSPRTFKRRLAEEGVVFSELLAEASRQRATALLRSGDLSIAEVADRVGYSDLANFTRAFRRWTGMTPSAYRRSSGRS
jgi:AraC-like DNA-binding protein